MSASQYRRQLEAKRKQRVEAEKQVGKYRAKEAQKRADAAKARQAASKTKSATTAASKLREAERREREAAAAGRDANRWQTRASDYAKAEIVLQSSLAKAEQNEAADAERRYQREQRRAGLQRVTEIAALEHRMDQTESIVNNSLRELRAPKPEMLRILLLGASSENGDQALRVGREQQRIRNAIRTALHRDFVRLDARPAATRNDLLDGIVSFRPHVVHFSGHSDTDVIEFEDDIDEHHESVIVTASAFAAAVKATDDPPLLVLLNSCNSAAQIGHLVEQVTPFAIGMSAEINDSDAIVYAAQFYAALANGQSINSAHLSGKAALELAGLTGSELPTLACASNVDPTQAFLVKGPPEVP